jgi:hypothetical protein
MNCIAITNFDMVTQNVFTGFQHTGMWYDYMTGQSLNVSDVNMTISLPPGGYKVYTDQQLPIPDLSITDSIFASVIPEPQELSFNTFVSPNPFNNQVKFRYFVNTPQQVSIVIYDILGKEVFTVISEDHAQGIHEVEWTGATKEGGRAQSGNYYYRISSQDYVDTGKLLMLE